MELSGTTRTGLTPAPKRFRVIIQKEHQNINGLPKKFEALPMGLSLRRFSGLFNPFANTCSVLCNHPAPTEVKQIINKCKHTLAIDRHTIQYLNDLLANKYLTAQSIIVNNIPEDLVRRYTDTDSRPLTPTPTITSIRTYTSAGSFLNNRRCITPELGKTDAIIKRKQLILDLRRSHSQETLYWKPPSDLSHSGLDEQKKNIELNSTSKINDKKHRNRSRQKTNEQKTGVGLVNAVIDEEIEGTNDHGIYNKSTLLCINEQYNGDDIRCGKKRKKIKTLTSQVIKTFYLSEDPETQVASLGFDSLNVSQRASIETNVINLKSIKNTHNQIPLINSFLTEEAFQTLKVELDVDRIENTFDRYLNRALREAYRFLPSREPQLQNEDKFTKENETKNIRRSALSGKMPRKFSKTATRFNVPINLKSLESMTVLTYLSDYVWISSHCKQIYKQTFLKYYKLKKNNEHKKINIEERDYTNCEGNQNQQPQQSTNDYIERTISMIYLQEALEDLLDMYGTEMNIRKIMDLLNFTECKANEINFRSWCGISAFAERFTLDETNLTDSCDELEKHDFESMELRLAAYNVSEPLKQVLQIIRNTHPHPH